MTPLEVSSPNQQDRRRHHPNNDEDYVDDEPQRQYSHRQQDFWPNGPRRPLENNLFLDEHDIAMGDHEDIAPLVSRFEGDRSDLDYDEDDDYGYDNDDNNNNKSRGTTNAAGSRTRSWSDGLRMRANYDPLRITLVGVVALIVILLLAVVYSGPSSSSSSAHSSGGGIHYSPANNNNNNGSATQPAVVPATTNNASCPLLPWGLEKWNPEDDLRDKMNSMDSRDWCANLAPPAAGGGDGVHNTGPGGPGTGAAATYYNCDCTNPYHAKGRTSEQDWPLAFQRNIRLVENNGNQPLDVVMLGDSITEHWLATSVNKPDHKYDATHDLYKQFFDQPSLKGLALAIAGDKIPNLIYRLQNGELRNNLKPRVWWVLIGTNDAGTGHCNAAYIAAGTVAIVEELLRHEPPSEALVAAAVGGGGPKVVINSLLPRGKASERLWEDPLWQILHTANRQLECYAMSHPSGQVHFFNATDLFLRIDDIDLKNESLYFDRVHPSTEGHRVWGDAIVQYVEHQKSSSSHSSGSGVHQSPATTTSNSDTTLPAVAPTTPSKVSCPALPWGLDKWDREDDLRDKMNSMDSQDWCAIAPQTAVQPLAGEGGVRSNGTGGTGTDATPYYICDCANPYDTKGRTFREWWSLALQRNIRLVENNGNQPLDVVMLGDSITEHWLGMNMNTPDHNYDDTHVLYKQLFEQPSLKGLALAIAGDKIPDLMYRLQNGELRSNLKPRVWWVLIGTNDADPGNGNCNAAYIAAGTVAIVEELLRHQPPSKAPAAAAGGGVEPKVVINSLLPRGKPSDRLWEDPVWQILRAANRQLECYAMSHPSGQVHFFNATELFLRIDHLDLKNESLYLDWVHPSTEGHRVWGEAIVQYVEHPK